MGSFVANVCCDLPPVPPYILQCALVRESRIAVLFLAVTVFRIWFLQAQVHLVVSACVREYVCMCEYLSLDLGAFVVRAL